MKTRLLFCTIIFFVTNFLICQNSPCTIIKIIPNKSVSGLWSPDSTKYLVNKKDANGIYQIYVGNKNDSAPTCISIKSPDTKILNWDKRQKMQVYWHPSGQWIICAVEKEKYNEQYLKKTSGGRKLLEGWLQCGLWMDIWAVKPDGSKWTLLATTIHGYTGPAFTPDGKKCAWAEALDSANLFKDKFGRWRLQLSEFDFDVNGNPIFLNTKNITPKGATWIEPGNFSPDGHTLLVSSDIGIKDAEGQDQFSIDIVTGEVKNLTNSPEVWDEHGVFSPDGKKILFMSSYPYRDDKKSWKTLTIKTEFMLMNADGSDLQQLTHFEVAGYAETSKGIAATGFWNKNGSVIYAQSLVFPALENWIIFFSGNCGNEAVK